MKQNLLRWLAILTLAALACGQTAPRTLIPMPTLAASPYDLGRTLYGFFPSPPEVSTQSVLDLYTALGQHADVSLLQQAVPWQEAVGEDFLQKPIGASQPLTDIYNQYVLAHQNGLDVIFVVDPLNGLNRSEFAGLPWGWQASFANPKVQTAFTNFTLRVVREFHPRYLGLASEINTYADTHPDDFEHYLSLYQAVYDAVKAEAPETQIFVTFQWEELNNLIPSVAAGRSPYTPNWDQVEIFEPRLDFWVISSYPFVAFPAGTEIPANYYTPLLTRTAKPLAVAEGGMPSTPPAAGLRGAEQDQVDYLNAIHGQLGDRLTFWIYLLLNDFSLDSYAPLMRRQGQGDDIGTLGMFSAVGLRTFDGTPKPALAIWDEFRK